MNDPDPTMQDASQELGVAMANQIDKDLIGVFASVTGGDAGPGAGQNATIATVAAGV